MAILDQLRNSLGIFSLNTTLSRTNIQARHALLRHTDGNLYIVWAEAYTTGGNEQRLYFAKSTDTGTTWSTPVAITTGNFDDWPAILQLNLSSTSSNIGIAFNRAATYDQSAQPTIYTVEIDTSGSVVSAAAPLTGSPQGRSICLSHTSTGYVVCAMINASVSSPVRFWTNTTFSTGAWATFLITNLFPANNEAFSLSLKRLANGDHAVIGAYRTGLSGNIGAGANESLADNVKTDVGVCFSTDNCATWTTVQNLTSYAGSAGISSTGLTCAANADLVQLSDNTVAVLFEEFKAFQVVNASTTLSSGTSSDVSGIVYHSSKNYIIFGVDDNTDGGIFIVDLTGATITRLHTGSTFALSDNRVRHIALSSDEKYLVTATQTGLDIIDTTNSSINSWTKVHIGTASTPATRVGPIAYARFDGTTDLYFAYDNGSGVSLCFGGKVNAATVATVTDLLVPTGFVVGDPTIRTFDFAGASLVYGFGTKVGKTLKSTGVGQYYVDTGQTILNPRFGVLYDDVNSELVAFAFNRIMRITDSGAALTVAQSFTLASTPAAISNTHQFAIPGSGIVISVTDDTFNEGCTLFYSFGDKVPTGILSQKKDSSLNDYWPKIGLSQILKATWLMFSFTGNAVWLDPTYTGRLRYGVFAYNTGTHQLTTAGVNFYDVANSATVGAAYKKLRFARVVRMSNDTLVISANKMDLTATTKQFSLVTGIVAASGATAQITARARISRSSTVTLSAKAKIGLITSRTFSVRARINKLSTLSIRAKIAEHSRTSTTLSTKANIAGHHEQAAMRVTFTVATPGIVRLRIRFFVDKGRYTVRKLNVKAKIAPKLSTRITCHFIVKMPEPTTQTIRFAATTRGVKQLELRARITR